MDTQQQQNAIRQMLSLIDKGNSQIGEPGKLTVSHYADADRLEKEWNYLFKTQPILLTHSSRLRNKGDFVSMDIGDLPIILNKDRHGKIRCFVNSCRHRGARLTDKPCGNAKAFKCPYHGWAYMDTGDLQFIPKETDAFPTLDKLALGLRNLRIEEVAGFIWLVPHNIENSIRSELSGIDNELEHFGLEEHVIRVSDIQRPRCNWKLVIDAFSEGYHLKNLHKDSVEPFFLDDGVIFERKGKHSRSIGARKEILHANTTPEQEWDFRGWTTPFYTLFPNTVLVFHPDWISRITVFPDGTDNCVVYHDMLVTKEANLEDSYCDKTFALINQQVFAKEDIAVCESIQSTVRSGADEHWVTGGLETPVTWFHQEIERALTLFSKEPSRQ
ncbi:hypothetical protein A9Q99_14035 [Gammaproteobacteria bacterium 45_16_T64]|nr:hypothetical protein A9Q99_14035 [Gammaproteobacteria bacterium 45_16_T64]